MAPAYDDTPAVYTPAQLVQLWHDLPALMVTTDWVQNFLAQPHPDLGRSGPVCPFVPRSLLLNAIRLSVVRMDSPDPVAVEQVVERFRHMFPELEPRFGPLSRHKAILILFPDLRPAAAADLIDATQARLKPAFVESGLMIGEFHRFNEAPGLHNPAFRPLRSPVPMLAIRSIVESDLPFLMRADLDPAERRVRLLESYLRHLADELSPAFRVTAEAALREALVEATAEMSHA